MKLDFRDPDPAIVDISPECGKVSTLTESRIECISGDKVSLAWWIGLTLKLIPSFSRIFIYTTSYSATLDDLSFSSAR